jgi:hypothetical protein
MVRSELKDHRRRDELFPEHVRPPVMAVQHWRNTRDVKPVRADCASLGRIGQPPVDAGIMAERELLVGMERLENRPEALTEQDALRKLAEALREFTVLFGKLEMTGKVVGTLGSFSW